MLFLHALPRFRLIRHAAAATLRYAASRYIGMPPVAAKVRRAGVAVEARVRYGKEPLLRHFKRGRCAARYARRHDARREKICRQRCAVKDKDKRGCCHTDDAAAFAFAQFDYAAFMLFDVSFSAVTPCRFLPRHFATWRYASYACVSARV